MPPCALMMASWSRLRPKPVTLGDTQDLQLAGRIEDGKQMIEVTAKQFDMSKIGDAGNPDIETQGGGLESFLTCSCRICCWPCKSTSCLASMMSHCRVSACG